MNYNSNGIYIDSLQLINSLPKKCEAPTRDVNYNHIRPHTFFQLRLLSRSCDLCNVRYVFCEKQEKITEWIPILHYKLWRQTDSVYPAPQYLYVEGCETSAIEAIVPPNNSLDIK